MKDLRPNKYIILLGITLLFGAISCEKQTAPPRVADSNTTANTVREMQGKPMRTFSGPAAILGDTTKNARKPRMVKEK